MTYEKNLRRCINISFGFAILFSLGVSAPMFIVVYPGDECLLFVSVRGEALIYGNPAGCNFIAYGHCIIILAGLILMGYIFIFKRRRPNSLQSPKKGTSSNRTLHGSNSLIQNPGTDEVDWRSPILGKLTQQEIGLPISLSTLIGIACLITAMVSISGYMISCNELQYETRRQVLGRTTLGSPIRSINMYCWSLFRDIDFHNRFHYDHYEYSGQWHGQYRGYQHGRVHQFETKHEHLINVAYALEISVASTWMASVFWFAIVTSLILLRRRQRYLNRRDIAESLEDAKIYAESLNQNPAISFIPSNGALSMQMKPVMPQDQVSLVSNGSSILKSNHHYQQLQPIIASTMPPTPVPGMGAAAPLPSHNLSHQFNPQSQPMLSSPNPQSNQVQYVQLSNGLLVPMGSTSQPNIHANTTQNMLNPQMQLQNNQINLQCYQTASASNLNPQQLMHQQMIQQQLHLQQLQLQQQQQQLISMGASPMGSATPHPHDFSRSQISLGVNLQDSDATDVTLVSLTNTKADQKKQIHLSKDAGFKCSQI